MTAIYSTHGDIALVTIANPPVNSLSLPVRQGIVAGIEKANASQTIKAIVLTGNVRAFCGGGDLHEFDQPQATECSHPELVNPVIERSPKPVVAALQGLALGGGLELAMACHYRIAASGIDVGLPEVKLGLVPGGGGTQRLPRSLGVEAALRMIIDGAPEKAEKLAELPDQRLFDRIVPPTSNLMDEAFVLARQAAHQAELGHQLPSLRSLHRSSPDDQAHLQAARDRLRTLAPENPALMHAVDLVAASTHLNMDVGLAQELAVFLALLASPEARALRHSFLAGRAAARAATALRTNV